MNRQFFAAGAKDRNGRSFSVGDVVLNGLAETRRCQTYREGYRLFPEIGYGNSRIEAGTGSTNGPYSNTRRHVKLPRKPLGRLKIAEA
jgi:hypothetical protein